MSLPIYNNSNARTSGYMPIWGQEKPSGERNSPQAGNDKSDFNKLVSKEYSPQERSAGISRMQEINTDGWSFFDFLDIINPLQHIPIVSTVYRAITGDEIKPVAMAIGGVVYGGPIGIISGSINAAVAEATGQGVTENLVAMATKKDNNNQQIEQNSKIMLAKENSVENTENFVAAAAVKPVNTVIGTEKSPALKPDIKSHNFLPPELIAQEMMSALDKYQEMKDNSQL